MRAFMSLSSSSLNVCPIDEGGRAPVTDRSALRECGRRGELVRVQYRVHVEYAHAVRAHGNDREELAFDPYRERRLAIDGDQLECEPVRMTPQHGQHEAHQALAAPDDLARRGRPAAAVGGPARL